ncbi:hypothetical protein C9J01_24610 [Photobacterium rosenbergii]|uniref:DUF2946 domain-containing protein n=2 Tax=Photobacterium rosenbergii TaxID=294936 RepID=A0A2T3N696_9GAMM|nr:hypothetical protein C9J01_24610 [Photobacterium rosenbergii]
MTFRRPHNMLALLMVLMISLIINPAFAMPGHQLMFYQQSTTGHHTNSDISSAQEMPAVQNPSMAHAGSHHPVKQQEMLHCNDCSSGTMMDSDHCGNDGDSKHCKSCNSSHCQYSALPVFHLAQSNLSSQEAPLRLLVSAPISRQETSLRPPIH